MLANRGERLYQSNVRDVFVAGDLHGDYDSFRKILEIYFSERKDSSLLIFLGDYADRGMYGLEIIMNLKEIIETQDDIIALKGNHEMFIKGRPIFSPCDLMDEAIYKYGSWEGFYKDVMEPFISRLYIAAIINRVLFIHAGICSKIHSMDDLSKEELEMDLLWSDPSPAKGEGPNMRGAGVEFGPDITEKVLEALGLEIIIRSHEPRKASNGPFVEHNGRVITTNACDSYRGAWKRFLLKLNTETLEYSPIFLD